MALLTGQPEPGGNSGVGYGKDSGGKISGMIANVQVAYSGGYVVDLFQHEMSHVFGCTDTGHTHSSGSSCPCLMCWSCSLSYVGYCYTCDLRIWLNRDRYDVKGYGDSVSDESYGNGSVTSPGNIKGAIVDRAFTRLYSGSYKLSPYNEAMLIVEMRNIDNPGASLSGTIYLQGYSKSSDSHLMVYTSDDNSNWELVKNTNFYTNPTAESGSYDLIITAHSNFKYVCIVVINDFDCVGELYFDNIRVF